MKKEIFKKVLVGGLVACSCLTMFGCDASKNPDTPSSGQEEVQKEVASVSLVASSVPNYIVKGHFNNANIKALVTYADNTTKEIAVTDAMLSAEDLIKVSVVGQYNIDITIGGKSVEMYANVVGEEYLLIDVINKQLGKDITFVRTGYNADDVDGKEEDYIQNITTQIDTDNKVAKRSGTYGQHSNIVWNWVNNEYEYSYYSRDTLYSVYKRDSSMWDTLISSQYLYYFDSEMIINKTFDGNSCTVSEVTKDESGNYVLTIAINNGPSDTYTYTFNEDYLLKVDTTGDYIGSISYTYNSVELEVPEDIKALESSAVEEDS